MSGWVRLKGLKDCHDVYQGVADHHQSGGTR